MLHRRTDRLLSLSGSRMALRHAGLTSPEAIMAATPEPLVRLGRHRGEILRLVQAGNPDVMQTLFLPAEPIDWQVAMLTSRPGERLLTVTRGSLGRVLETLVSLRYHAADREGERRAWRALKAALK